MAAHVKRLPTEKDGIRADGLSYVLRVERVKLLAVFPVKQFGIFRLQKPAGRSKRHVSLPRVELGHSLADGHRVGMRPALREVGSGDHRSPYFRPLILSRTEHTTPHIDPVAFLAYLSKLPFRGVGVRLVR